MNQLIEPISAEVEAIGAHVVDAALRVHRNLGPGLLEVIYETCMCYEPSKRSIAFERQKEMPISYEGVKLDAGLRIDLLVGNSVVVELKSVQQHLPLFEAQLLTYLKLTGKRLGLLINFNVPLLKDGIKRIVL